MTHLSWLFQEITFLCPVNHTHFSPVLHRACSAFTFCWRAQACHTQPYTIFSAIRSTRHFSVPPKQPNCNKSNPCSQRNQPCLIRSLYIPFHSPAQQSTLSLEWRDLPGEGSNCKFLGFFILELPEWEEGSFLASVFIWCILKIFKI